MLQGSLSRNLASAESIKPSTGLDPQTGIVLGVSAIVALLCSALIGRAIRSAKQREIDSHLHSERAALCQALMESLGVLVSEGSNGGRNGTGDLFAVEKALFLRGSVAVNNEYRALLRLLSDPGADEKVLRSQITRFLLALRRDCGQSTYGLESEDWSDLVRFPSRQVASERNGRLPAATFPRCSRGPSDPPPLASRMTPIPQISCLMPTADRRAFVPQAIRYFLAQDYPEKELIIVDDGADSVADLVPDDPRFRYFRRPARQPIGAKRNFACREARGDVIVHWDDDDWSAPWRLRYQVEHLRENRADICGLSRVYFYAPAEGKAWEYVYPPGQRPWVYGASLCYTRAFWQAHPFPEIRVGEDTRFVWADARARVYALADSRFLVALVHRNNISPKRTSDPRYRPKTLAEVEALLGKDVQFYRGPEAGKTARPVAAGFESRPLPNPAASRQREYFEQGTRIDHRLAGNRRHPARHATDPGGATVGLRSGCVAGDRLR